MSTDPRHTARNEEERRQQAIIDATAKRNAEIAAGAPADPNIGTLYDVFGVPIVKAPKAAEDAPARRRVRHRSRGK